MALNKILPILGQLNLTSGVEGALLHGKFNRDKALITGITGLLIQILIDTFGEEHYLQNLPGYLINFGEFVAHMVRGEWEFAVRIT